MGNLDSNLKVHLSCHNSLIITNQYIWRVYCLMLNLFSYTASTRTHKKKKAPNQNMAKCFIVLVGRARFELATNGLKVRHSIAIKETKKTEAEASVLD